MKKDLLILQSYLLSIGVVFAGYNFVDLVHRYLVQGGSFVNFRIPGGLVNPLLSPCFWGLVVFVVALVWAIILRINYSRTSQYRLIWLLTAGAMFAWGNYAYELARIAQAKACNLGCTPGYFGIPEFTSCVVGATLFTLALIVALVLRKKG